ncbi:phage tail tape measure protein [uncultured Selenomonas sp.]|uniref:phage tail tape measure protein n=1 Tax=uncultured Selenomonas sp. TaxID=159275 RepID=UPI0028E4D9D3|nr:phage tail tape measure protein [uncultured Selenomonas sp.]
MGKLMELAFSISGKLGSTFTGSTQKASQSLAQLKAEAKKLEAAVKETERAQKLLNQSFESGFTSEKAYATNMAAMKKNLMEYNSALLKNADLRAKAAGADIGEQADGKSGGMLSKAMGVAAKAVSFGAIAGGIQSAVGAAVDFESAMADVRKVVDFDTPQQFKDMQQDILKLTRTLPMTAEDIAKIVASGGQAGIAKEDLLGFAESAAKMGVAFDITAEQAGDMMAKWRTAFKMNQDEVVTLADKVNYLGNTTAASAPLISEVITRIGPLGEVGGVASGEIAALGASIVGSGVSSEIAATGIKNLVLGMTAGEGATKTQADAFASLGMDATEMAKRMQVDAKGAIIDVMKAIRALDKDQQATVLKDLFGKESIGAIAPLLSNLEGLEENFNKVADAAQYGGSMNAEFQARCETTENSLQLMKNAAGELAINLGSVLLPYIKDGTEAISKLVHGLISWGQENPGIIAGMAEMAKIVTFLLVAYKVGAGISVLSMALQAASLSTRAMTLAQTALNLAMSLNPVGLVIMGVAALIAIGYELYMHWEEVKTFFVGMWESPAGAILSFMGGPITALIYIVSLIIANWEAVKAWFTLLWDDPAAAVTQFVDFLEEKIGVGVEWVKQKWEGLKEVLAHPIDAVVNFISDGDSNAAAASGVDISANARGGIYGQGAFLTTFAEDSPEAAIPIDGSARAASLWRQTGEMMGLLPQGGGGVSLSISAPITINGNADSSVIAQIQQGIDDAVKQALARIQHERGRVSFA